MPTTRILIVEDETVVALDLRSSLESLGYTVVACATTGDEAIRLVDSTSPNVVLMDINLRGTIDGIEAYTRIRTKHNIPVIYLTAYSDPDTLDRAKITEPFGYILKPFELRELRTTIEMALHKYGLEKKLIESERKFRELTDLLPQTVFEMTLDGTLTFVNRHGLETFGYTEAEFASGLSVVQMVAPSEKDLALHRLSRLTEESKWNREVMMVRRDGVEFPAVIYLSKIERERSIVGLRGIVADVSEFKKSQDRLRASEQKLALHVQQTMLGAIAWDVKFCVTEWNPAAERIFGYTREEALGRNGVELVVSSEQRASIQEIWNSLLTRRGGNTGTNQNITKDGRIIDCEWFNTPLVDDKGNVIGVASLVQDVTERKMAEEQVRKLSRAVEQSPAAILITDTAGRIEYVNNAFTEMSGYDAADVLGHNPRILKSGHTTREEYATMWNLLSGGGDWKGEFLNRKKNGDLFWESASIYPVRDAEGRPTHYLAVKEDITEQKKVRERLRDNEERLELITESVHDAIIVIDEDGKVTFWNAAAVSIFGYEKNEAEGQFLYPLIVPARYNADVVDALTPFRGKSGKGVEQRMEIPARRKDGTEIVAEVSVSPIQLKGRPHAVGIIRDITERKAAEGALARYTEELLDAKSKAEDQTQLLEIQAIELREAREAALEVSRLKSEFVANMSHEIRTPMNGVIGMTALLADTALTQEQKEYVQIIQTSGDALLRIINDILDFSKIESGKVELEKIEFRLHSLVDDAMGLHTLRAQQKGVELAYLVHSDVPNCVKGDPGRISQALANLVGNAIKFTERGEVVVHVSLESDDESGAVVRFTISDTGIGIAEEEAARLFQPFTQADGTVTRKYGGTGLGLTISKRLVELMGGTIGFESEKGQGSSFWFTTPLEKVCGDENVCQHDLTPFSGLIVDDNETNRDIVQQMLRSWGISADSADNGQEALRLLKQVSASRRYDFVILDMQMAGMDGLSLAGYIKADRGLASTHLIMLSSMGQVRPATYLESGVEVLLTKPVRQSSLYNALVHLLCSETSESCSSPDQRSVSASTEPEGLDVLFDAHVLVAEDNEVNQEVAVRMLRKIGCSVDVVSDGEQAVRRSEECEYAAIFMDCHMPVMDGYRATGEIRTRDGSGKHTVIIAMTANALRGDREECIAAGMDDYIPKPVKVADLTAVLRKWLNHKNGQSMTREGNGREHWGRPSSTLDVRRIELLKSLNDEQGDEWLQTLFQKFLTDAEKRVKDLVEALDVGDVHTARTTAHTLKGSSFNVGATGMMRICQSIEEALEKQAMQSCQRRAVALQNELGHVRDDLQNHEFLRKVVV